MLAGWRLALSVGLAGVRAAGRRGRQGGGVRLEGAGRAGDRAGGPLLIGQADTAQAGQIGQAVTVGGAVLPGADRGGGGADRGGQRAEEKPGQAARCVRCCSGFASLPAWWCRAVVLPGGGGGADRGQAAGTSPAAQFPPAQFQPEPFQGGTVSPPDDPAKCRRAKGSDSSLNGISPHR